MGRSREIQWGDQGKYNGEIKGNTMGRSREIQWGYQGKYNGDIKGGYYTVYRVNFCHRFLIILPISELALYRVDSTV